MTGEKVLTERGGRESRREGKEKEKEGAPC